MNMKSKFFGLNVILRTVTWLSRMNRFPQRTM